jgi:DNA invertase Pin-like site-specific DNA recombinase
MRNAIIYLRVSSKEQADSRLGLEAQEASCRQLAERLGFNVSDVVTDAGISASIPWMLRKHGRSVFEHMRREPVTVIALCRDRVFRSVSDYLATMDLFAEFDSEILLVDGGRMGGEEPEIWLAEIMQVVFGEFERRIGGKRMKRALAALKARGGTFGPAPLGKRAVKGTATQVEDPAEMQVIQRIVELSGVHRLANGRVNGRAIARQMNVEGFRTRGGRFFTHVQVLRALRRVAA